MLRQVEKNNDINVNISFIFQGIQDHINKTMETCLNTPGPIKSNILPKIKTYNTMLIELKDFKQVSD